MTTKETSHAIGFVDVTHCRHYTEPASGIFGELWVGRLKQNLDSI
jgi:hypothetical protein